MPPEPASPSASLPPSAAVFPVETRWVLGLFCLALVWTVSASYALAEPAGKTTYLFGFPRWFFWGVLLPWLSSYALSLVFCFCVMQDEPLGDADASEADEALDEAARKEADRA